MTTMTQNSGARVGRPRRDARSGDDRPVRQQILDAAAYLFASQGYAATSTRQIAERAGMRQATLYYHVDGKAQILSELLDQTVRPTLEVLGKIEALPDPEAALAELAATDVDTLVRAPHRLATLYSSPELAGPEFAEFRAHRDTLRRAYVDLVTRIGRVPDPEFIGRCCLQLVELATDLAMSGSADDALPHRIAAACLTLAGVPEGDRS